MSEYKYIAVFEDFRRIKLHLKFDGNVGKGKKDILLSINNIDTYVLDKEEFIYEVFYRVITPLVSSNNTTTKLTAGIRVDSPHAILDTNTGVLDVLNSNAGGIRIHPSNYTKASVDGRAIELKPIDGDITAGEIEIILTVARCNC